MFLFNKNWKFGKIFEKEWKMEYEIKRSSPYFPLFIFIFIVLAVSIVTLTFYLIFFY